MGNWLFISYSHQEDGYTHQLIRLLEARGFSVWVDHQGLKAGTPNWEETIRDAIRQASALILLASENSRTSRWVLAEIDIAEAYNCPIIPLWVNGEKWVDCAPMGLIKTQRIDARQGLTNDIIDQLAMSISQEKPLIAPTPTESKCVFITYSHDDEQSQMLADKLEQTLTEAGYDIYIDMLAIPIGSSGTKRVLREIDNSQFIIPMISDYSAQNEMLWAQLDRAHKQGITILPIRVNYHRPYPYDIRILLADLGAAVFEDNFSEVMHHIQRGLHGEELPKSNPIATQTISIQLPPTSSADPSMGVDPAYIKRHADSNAWTALNEHDAGLLTIRAPNQMGKTSLALNLGRIIAEDHVVAYVDFRTIDRYLARQENTFCLWLAKKIATTSQLSVPAPETVWREKLGGVLMLTTYMQQYILPHFQDSDQMLILIFDEVDVLLDAPFRSAFFGMIRNWFNNRADDDRWYPLIQILIISTDPMLFIENLNMSPFNVGVPIMLNDFSTDDILQLCTAYGVKLSPATIDELHHYLGGHPYLTRDTIFRVANGTPLNLIINKDIMPDHPFYDHLMRYTLLLGSDNSLTQAFLDVLDGQAIPKEMLYRLNSVGLMRLDGSIRCTLYREFFSKRLRYD